MKKLFTFLLTLCGPLLSAQISFPMPGAVWHYEVEVFPYMAPSTFTNTTVAYTHDTLFMGRTAKIMTADFYRACPPESGKNLFYTSNDSVYFYNSRTMGQWQLLYNFSVLAGQSWETHLQDMNGVDTITTTVDSVRYTLINSVSLKTLYVTYSTINHFASMGPYHSVIYERIGDMNYLFNYYPDIYTLCDFGNEYRGVLCYSDSTFTLYQPDSLKDCNYTSVGIPALAAPDKRIELWPNPFTNELVAECHDLNRTADCTISDVTGKVLYRTKLNGPSVHINTEALPAGFYFVTADGLTKKMLKLMP